MMKPDSALAAAHHQLMSSHHKLSEASKTSSISVSGAGSEKSNSVKAEPLDQMSLYSSHFASAASKPPHPLTGMSQHDSSMLTGLPHLTPAPYTTSHHQGFSLDDMKYPNTHSHVHPQPDYSSFAAASATSAAAMTASAGGVFGYPTRAVDSALDIHSNHHIHHHHHHHKLNLQTS